MSSHWVVTCHTPKNQEYYCKEKEMNGCWGVDKYNVTENCLGRKIHEHFMKTSPKEFLPSDIR